MFVFDSLSVAQNGQIQIISRDEQFAPIKNAKGEDSIATSRQLLLDRGKSWLNAAGIKSDEKIEISPLFAPTKEYFIEECRKRTPFNIEKKDQWGCASSPSLTKNIMILDTLNKAVEEKHLLDSSYKEYLRIS